MMRVYDLAASLPWAILPDSLRTILEISAREHELDPEALSAKLGRKLDNARSVTVRDGVAIIPIEGPIFRRANLFTEISGATSLEMTARDFRAALDDPAVKAIMLEIDSPGGEVAGTNEFAGQVFAARGKKPILAYVDYMAASAAYWIASAADEVVMDPSASVGSIGVVATVPNPEKRSARELEFVSSQSPKKREDPTTESGKAQIQGWIDAIAEVFIEAVARNRGVTGEKVLSDFGAGSLLVGRAAVEAGMADRIGSFEEVLAELVAKTTAQQRSSAFGGRAKGEETAVGGRADAPEAAQTEETMAKKTLWEQLKAVLGGDSGEAAEALAMPASAAETTAVEEAPVVRAEASPAIAQVEEVETLKAQLRLVTAAASVTLETSAKSYFASLVKEGKAFPHEEDGVVEALVQAGKDDLASPVAENQVSRAESIKAIMNARPANNLTTEQLQVLPNSQTETVSSEMTPERRRDLLSKTPAGQAVLREVKGAK